MTGIVIDEPERARSRGFDLIRSGCRSHGSPPPDFRWDNGLWMELPVMEVEETPPLTPPVSPPVEALE